MRQGKEQNFLINQKENPKRTIGKLPKGIHEVGKGSWKEREVGKSEMKLERSKLESSGRSWKARTEVGKLGLKLESLNLTWKANMEKILHQYTFFQLQTFQLPFPTTRIPTKT